MSLESVLKMLQSFGLSPVESEVYIYLAKAGSSKARDVGRDLNIAKQQLYPVLNSLREKGLVVSKPECAVLFSALAFEELLNIFMKIGAEKVKAIEETREELINNWKNVTKQNKS